MSNIRLVVADNETDANKVMEQEGLDSDITASICNPDYWEHVTILRNEEIYVAANISAPMWYTLQAAVQRDLKLNETVNLQLIKI